MSIMSTTGDTTVGQATQEALVALLSAPATSRREAVERAVSIFRVIGSPGFELDEADLRERAGSPMTAPTIRSASPASYWRSSPPATGRRACGR
jgi:hypothetical protein